MLNQEEVQHIADLARMALTDQEVKKYQKQLGLILDYMEKLKDVKTNNVPTANGGTIDLENVWRQDEIGEKPEEVFSPEINQEESILIKMAPEVENGQIKVKSVFNI